MISGDNGIFDVVVDGDLIYSKHDTGSFPTEDEISDTLKSR